MNTIYLGDELPVLESLKTGSIDLVYIRLPGRFDDMLDRDLLQLEPRLDQARRVLAAHGSLYLHSAPPQVHYVKALLLDGIFGRGNFVNEIIWATEGSRKQTTPWPARHDSLLMYARDHQNRKFNRAAIDRIPYMAPGLVSDRKEREGKLPTDTWWFTQNITGREVVKRVVAASSAPGDVVLDFFAGDGLTGEVCRGLDRRFILIEGNPDQQRELAGRYEGEEDIKILRIP